MNNTGSITWTNIAMPRGAATQQRVLRWKERCWVWAEVASGTDHVYHRKSTLSVKQQQRTRRADSLIYNNPQFLLYPALHACLHVSPLAARWTAESIAALLPETMQL
jgi:hypothetical protein